MIRTTIMQKVVVENANGKVFEAEFNQMMKELAIYKPQVFYPQNVPGHCAYITFTEEVEEAENAKDRLELKGIRPVCGQCPFYEEPGDGRKKEGKCMKKLEPWCHYTKPACLYLCDLLENELVELKH